MNLGATQISFLQRLVADRPASRRSSEVAEFFARHYAIGRATGRVIIYAADDWENAGRLLDNRKIPRHRLTGLARRSETAAFTGVSEKSFGETPNSDAVAVKPAWGECQLNNNRLLAPDGGYMVLTVADVLSIRCDRLIVIENLETFRFLSRYRWIDYCGVPTLAIYRGDRLFNPGDAIKVIESRKEPVLSFADFDPAGLAIASRTPRLERLILPDEAWLSSVTEESRRFDLFENQSGQFRALLDKSVHPDIARAWALMKVLRKGFPQEWMQEAPVVSRISGSVDRI